MTTNQNVTAAHDVVERLKKQIADFRETAAGEVTGRVREVGDGIAKISGLTNVSSMEMVTFEDGTNGVALNLEEEQVGAIVLGDASHVAAGQSVTATGKVLSIPVGKKMTGRVVDPLGRPVDGKGPIAADAEDPVEKVAPGVMTREPVAIGQKESKVAKIVQKLKEAGAMEYTTVVVAGASDPASLQFISPYSGCAIGEWFMDQGGDALVVYDDLSKH